LIGQLALNALHGFGADAMRHDRAARAAPGQEITADRGFLLRRDPRPPNVLALRLGARHAGLNPLGNEGTLELREASHDPEDQLALRCRGIGAFALTDEIDAQGAELLEGIDQLLHRAREAVVAPDQQNIEPALAGRIQQALILGPRAMIDGMGWMMDGMGLIGLLVFVVLILAAAGLVKYLLSRK
jgi:hypothetical protein